MNAAATLENAGFENIMGMSSAWAEALGDMGAEFIPLSIRGENT